MRTQKPLVFLASDPKSSVFVGDSEVLWEEYARCKLHPEFVCGTPYREGEKFSIARPLLERSFQEIQRSTAFLCLGHFGRSSLEVVLLSYAWTHRIPIITWGSLGQGPSDLVHAFATSEYFELDSTVALDNALEHIRNFWIPAEQIEMEV